MSKYIWFVFLFVVLGFFIINGLVQSSQTVSADYHHCMSLDWQHDKHCPTPTHKPTNTKQPTKTPTKTMTPTRLPNVTVICCPKGVQCFRGCYFVTPTPARKTP